MTDIIERLQDPEQYVDRDGPVPWPSVVDDAVTEIKEYRRVAQRVGEILIGEIGAGGPEKVEMTATRAAARLRLYQRALNAIAEMGQGNTWGPGEMRNLAMEVLDGVTDTLDEWERAGENMPVGPREHPRLQPARKGFEDVDDKTVLLGSLSLVRACRYCGVLVSGGATACAFCRTIFLRTCSFCGKDSVQGIDAVKGTFFCVNCGHEILGEGHIGMGTKK